LTILIADDHWMVRESLKAVLRRLDRGQTVLEASSFDEALEVLSANHDVEMFFVDLVMPGVDEFVGLQRVRSEFPDVPIAVVSVHEDRERLMFAIEAGAVGYIPKSASGQEIESAIERILAGDVYFPRRLIRQSASSTPPVEIPNDAVASLTPREKELLGFLGNGYSVRKIAEALGISDHTVRVHLSNLVRKLGHSDRAETIHFAINLAKTSTFRSQTNADTRED
jgi:DNA-binding NarL/FixJ family response regulator